MALLDFKSALNVILIAIVAFYVYRDYKKNQQINLFDIAHTSSISPQKANQKLIEHNKIWNNTAEIIKCADGVYLGHGFALASTIFLETDKSLIIVDTTESVEAAQSVRKAFNESTPSSTHNKPISTIIYTHFHPDHTNGGEAFIDDPANPPIIYSHPKTLEQITRIFSIASSINNVRSTRQFGTLLHDVDSNNNLTKMNNNFENSGIGPFLKFGDKYSGFIQLPTKLLNDDYTNLKIDNLNIDIYFAPGETPDQIFIYLPDKRVLIPADNIYEAFPNIYAIRGSPTRNARQWFWSLDKMRALQPKPKVLVPCHTRPVFGEKKIESLLRDYRDGIAYVHDQTVRFLNKGLTPNEIIPLIHQNMPKRLKDHPYLQEFYGTIDWSVRGIFHSYLGWFSGDAVDLFPLSDIKTGEYLIKLFDGDIDKLLNEAKQNIVNNNGDRDLCQWGLKIATQILYYYKSQKSQKGNIKNIDEMIEKSKNLRIDGLNCMASFMVSANGRNYYLTQAIEEEMESGSLLPSKKRVDWALQQVPIDQIMTMQTVRIKLEEMDDKWKNIKICWDFDDKWFQFALRDGVGEIKRGSTKLENDDDEEKNIENIINDIMVDHAYITLSISREECHSLSDIVMEVSVQDFKDMISEYKHSSAMIYAKGKINMIKGSILDMTTWKSMLELQ